MKKIPALLILVLAFALGPMSASTTSWILLGNALIGIAIYRTWKPLVRSRA